MLPFPPDKLVPPTTTPAMTVNSMLVPIAGQLLPILEKQEDYSNDALYACLLEYVKEKGCKNGQALWPIRIAMSGKQTTPCGASEMMEVLGKEESLKRLRAAIEKLENEKA